MPDNQKWRFEEIDSNCFRLSTLERGQRRTTTISDFDLRPRGAPPSTPALGGQVGIGLAAGVVADGAGNALIASSDLNGIFKLDSGGTLTIDNFGNVTVSAGGWRCNRSPASNWRRAGDRSTCG
jgi:hypothetical protein